MSATLQEIEDFEEMDSAIMICEAPDECESHRDAVATSIFDAASCVQAVCCIPSPLASLYNGGYDTGILIDIGHTATFILLLFDGSPVLRPTLHPIGGKHLTPGAAASASAPCEGLLDPSLLLQMDDSIGGDEATDEPTETPACGVPRGTCGVHEACVRAVALVDASIRAPLLANVVLVGGGTALGDFPTQLEEALAASVGVRRWAACEPHVVARNE